jgi:hypothetical protein
VGDFKRMCGYLKNPNENTVISSPIL